MTRINEHTSVYHFVRDLCMSGFSPREWIIVSTWKWIAPSSSDAADGGSPQPPPQLVIAYEAVQEHSLFPPQNPKSLRGVGQMYCAFSLLPSLAGGVPQTRITFTQWVNSPWTAAPNTNRLFGDTNRLFAERLWMHLSRMRACFDKSAQVDATNREANVALFAGGSKSSYTEREADLVQRGLGLFEVFEEREGTVELRTPSVMMTAKMKYETDADGDCNQWGWASSLVRATPVEVLAHVWDVERRTGLQGDDMEVTVLEARNEHNQLVARKKRTLDGSASNGSAGNGSASNGSASREFLNRIASNGSAIYGSAIYGSASNREFLNRTVWRETTRQRTAADFVVVSVPEDDDPLHSSSGSSGSLNFSRSFAGTGKFLSALKINKVKNSPFTRIEFVVHPVVGPARLETARMMKNLEYVMTIQEFFQSLRALESWTADDGRAIGEALMTKTLAEENPRKGQTQLEARVAKLFKKHRGLAELGEKYDFFPAMLVRIIENGLRPASEVETRLQGMSKTGGREIAKALAGALASNLTSGAAVGEWILWYAALRELDEEFCWFRPMVEVMA